MESLLAELSRISDYGTYGRVAGVQGLLVEVAGQLGQQRFEAIFEQDVEDEMNLIDRDIFAASRADPAAG